MRAALAVHRVGASKQESLERITALTKQASSAGADLILFAEAALTGLVNNDDPTHDLPLGEPISGYSVESLARLAAGSGIWLATGLLEREDRRLYDSAALFGPDGALCLRYRRIQPQWHGYRADPSIYRHGEQVNKAETPLGSFLFLICGDLYDDQIVAMARDERPDWILYPVAISFEDGVIDQERWEREEKLSYIERIKHLGATVLMTNYLGGGQPGADMCYGGALAVTGDGQIRASLPLGKEGITLVDL